MTNNEVVDELTKYGFDERKQTVKSVILITKKDSKVKLKTVMNTIEIMKRIYGVSDLVFGH